MEQNLFSQDELTEIEDSARRNQILREENYIDLGFAFTDIINLSYHHGLILTKGNEHTGFEHILARHELYSGQAYWKEDKGKISLAYPSKFSPQSIPIINYVLLADELYRPEFLNLAKNKDTVLFDLYEGIPAIDIAEQRRYRMLLYKGTKVIHTLYPTNDKYIKKKPKGFIFQRGKVETSENIMTGDITIKIAYIDHHQTKRYSVIILYQPHKKLRTIKIEIHRKDKADLCCDYPPEVFNDQLSGTGFLHVQHKYIDMVEIEKEIVRIENDKVTWDSFP